MMFLFTLVAFIVALGMLILVHEMGHYWVARWSGVKVLRFSIGFGKSLLVWRAGKDKTEWALGAFPLGGYVKMLDEREGNVPETERHRSFNQQSVWKRIAIVAAGPAANMLFAVFIYWCMSVIGVNELRPRLAVLENVTSSAAQAADIHDGDLVLDVDGESVQSWQDLRWLLLRYALNKQKVVLRIQTFEGIETFRTLDLSGVGIGDEKHDFIQLLGLSPWFPPAVLGRIAEGGRAAEAGLKSGDRVLSINGEVLRSWGHFVTLVSQAPEESLHLIVERQGKTLEMDARPAAVAEQGRTIGRLNVGIVDAYQNIDLFARVSYGPLKAVSKAVQQTWETTVLSFQMIGRILTGQVSWRNLSGPVTIAEYAGKTAQIGLDRYLMFVALISISLGVMNLLPIPVLDGGLLLYYLIEVIKGSPVSDRVMEVGLRIGVAVLAMLMLLAFYNDINRLVSS